MKALGNFGNSLHVIMWHGLAQSEGLVQYDAPEVFCPTMEVAVALCTKQDAFTLFMHLPIVCPSVIGGKPVMCYTYFMQ